MKTERTKRETQIEVCSHKNQKLQTTVKLKVCDDCYRKRFQGTRFLGTWVGSETYKLFKEFCINHEMPQAEAFTYLIHESAFAFQAERYGKFVIDKQFEKAWEPIRKRWQSLYQRKTMGKKPTEISRKEFLEDKELECLLNDTIGFMITNPTAKIVAALSLVRFQGIYPSVLMATSIVPG